MQLSVWVRELDTGIYEKQFVLFWRIFLIHLSLGLGVFLARCSQQLPTSPIYHPTRSGSRNFVNMILLAANLRFLWNSRDFNRYIRDQITCSFEIITVSHWILAANLEFLWNSRDFNQYFQGQITCSFEIISHWILVMQLPLLTFKFIYPLTLSTVRWL